jgi:uncharacterized protein (DUF1501 family)
MNTRTESVNTHMNEPRESARGLLAPLTRRGFVTKGMAFVGIGSVLPAAFIRATFAESMPPGAVTSSQRRALVVLQLGGGNDGLNTVIPYADGAYYDARPHIGVAPEAALHLDGAIALNPEMQGLKALYDAGNLAIVQGVGYPNPDRSHFRSMEIWHTASMTEHAPTGWLGRLLDATHHEQDALWRAASIGSEVPESLAAVDSFVPSLESVQSYGLQMDRAAARQASRRTTDWMRLYAQQAAMGGALALLSRTGTEAYASSVSLKSATSAYQPRATYPANALGSALQTAAQLITSNLGTGICYVTTGGFDTHAAENAAQPALLRGVSEAVAAFYADLGAQGLASDVLTMMWTEFGRRVRENGSLGTDHGTAGPVFLMGGGVRGGLYGEAPSVRDLDGNGDLRFTTDFRSVYASLLVGWFATDPRDVLDAAYPTIPFLG